jgi:hypothetical protein
VDNEEVLQTKALIRQCKARSGGWGDSKFCWCVLKTNPGLPPAFNPFSMPCRFCTAHPAQGFLSYWLQRGAPAALMWPTSTSLTCLSTKQVAVQILLLELEWCLLKFPSTVSLPQCLHA